MSLKEKIVLAAAAALGLTLGACGPASQNGGTDPATDPTAGGAAAREPGTGGAVREPSAGEAGCGGGHSH